MTIELRTQAVISMASGIPADAVMNTWHFQHDGGTGLVDAINDVEQRLQLFYGAMQSQWPNTVGTTITYKTYDLADPLPRIPRRVTPLTIAPSAVAPLPHEVALVLSFGTTPEPGINPGSLRGRIYFGPLKLDVTAVTAGRVSTALMTQLRDAAATMAGAVGSNTAKWSVYSPTRDAAGASVADSFRGVTRFHVDNAFDTQRRRGVLASTRLTGIVP